MAKSRLKISLTPDEVDTILYKLKGPCRTLSEQQICAKIRRAITLKKKRGELWAGKSKN